MFTSAAGYEMPAFYTSIEKEHRAVREGVGMIDLSLMGRIDVKGTQAMQLLQNLAVNDVSKLVDGQVMYTTFCNNEGNMVDDVTVWRIGENHFRVVTSSVMRYKTLAWIGNHLTPGTHAFVTDISSSLGMIAVQGPQSRRTLQRIVDIDLSGLRFFHFLNANLGGVRAVVARLGFSGELGYECYISTEDTVQAWHNIQDAGKEDGITPYGLDALDSLRFEKGFIFFGYEVTEKNNPYEVGLEKWIKLDKPEFLGKESLSRLNSRGPERRLSRA